MKKVQSCDDLTDQQKKTRVEWIIAELQDYDILPYNYVYDRDWLVIGDPEEVDLHSSFLSLNKFSWSRCLAVVYDSPPFIPDFMVFMELSSV